MVRKKNEEHWDFLEKIEAPMWADLTLEAKLSGQECSDDWFHKSHPFHQSSAVELKRAFNHNVVGNTESGFNLQESFSPNLPSSVSRSRGKHYNKDNRKLGTKNHGLLFNKKHPVNTLSGNHCQLDSEPREKQKPKSSCESSQLLRSSKTSFVCQHVSSGGIAPNSTSTITSENSHQPQKLSDVSSQVSNLSFDRTTGILTALRTNFRKKCITGQAARAVGNDGGHSKGFKSSSSKFSVGSSSNFSHAVRNKTAIGGVHVGMSQPENNRVKAAGVLKASSIRVEEKTFNCRMGGKTSDIKATYKDAAKSKAPCQTFLVKPMKQLGVNVGHPLRVAAVGKEKIQARNFNRPLHDGKENAVTRNDGSQRFFNKHDPDHKVQRQTAVLRNTGKAKLVGTMGMAKAKTQTNAARKFFPR